MLEILWYLVIAASITFYVILDGFDLGVGILHLLSRTDEQRRIFLNSIGPVWDGNEVWIVIVIGGLFAGFPNVYATVLSGFYTLLMILLAAFMFRAAAIEFRSKVEAPFWRSLWDTVFSTASIIVAFILGLILGNLIEGVPLNEAQDFIGTFSDFFRPYSVLIGFTAVALFAMHGSIYLSMKTEGKTHELIRRWVNPSIILFILLYAAASVVTIIFRPDMTLFFRNNPIFFPIPILALLAILNIPRQIKKGNDGWAFLFSCISIALLLSLFAFGTFPRFVLSTVDPEINSLTIYNTSSSPDTLVTLLVMAAIGVPLVLCYGVWVYRVFRGKVKLHKMSY